MTQAITGLTRQARVVIEGVKPEVDGGRFPIKRVVGETVRVEANIFAEGHDELTARLLYRHEDETEWHESPMTALGNDRWRGEFTVSRLGHYRYAVRAWVDEFATWRRDLIKRIDAKQDLSVSLLVGSNIVQGASRRTSGIDAKRLLRWSESLASLANSSSNGYAEKALEDELSLEMAKHPDTSSATVYDRDLTVVVDTERARFSTWYEMFPRSCTTDPNSPGALKDCEARLPYVAEMGFDVLYLPPIHPIGVTFRKGKNNNPVSVPGDLGSPWAIGSVEGGHKSIHPQLGTLEDFRSLVARAKQYGIDLALDIAFQCSPDHPYVREHPEWFRHRPDGTIQYAENPPKRYQDIYPLDFESSDWRGLWEELKSVFEFWIKQGVRIFRVDNPHTKPFAFWEWVIAEIKRDSPETVFLAEAFTRPSIMYRLGKLGFTQSYTYFAWRNTKHELTEYFTELTQTEVADFYRPNLWPNTPDILTDYLQHGGRPAFIIKLALAATLGASYGIYGPAFELCENRALEPGSEEYFDSEKYAVRAWDIDDPASLKDIINRVNNIRKTNPALQTNSTLKFHTIDNDQLIAYSKSSSDGTNIVVTVVNLDPWNRQSGWLDLPLEEFGLDPAVPYQMHDLFGDGRYRWYGPRNYVELDPWITPVHILVIRRWDRTEHDFEYFS